MRNQTVSLIQCAKKAYFDKVNHDISNPKISTKKWWSISKRLCGGNEVTSIPAIVEDGVTDTDPIEKQKSSMRILFTKLNFLVLTLFHHQYHLFKRYELFLLLR